MSTRARQRAAERVRLANELRRDDRPATVESILEAAHRAAIDDEIVQEALELLRRRS